MLDKRHARPQCGSSSVGILHQGDALCLRGLEMGRAGWVVRLPGARAVLHGAQGSSDHCKAASAATKVQLAVTRHEGLCAW